MHTIYSTVAYDNIMMLPSHQIYTLPVTLACVLQRKIKIEFNKESRLQGRTISIEQNIERKIFISQNIAVTYVITTLKSRV